jgi:hypothetical protein
VLISDAMETGTVQINSAPARGPDHFPFQVNKKFLKMLTNLLLYILLQAQDISLRNNKCVVDRV